MNERIVIFIKHFYKDIVSVILIILAVTALIMHFLDVEHMDLDIPISYMGTDDMSALVTARMIQDSGWNFGTNRISAPDSYYCNTDEIISGLHNMDVGLTKFFILFSGDNIAKAVNYVYLLIFYLIAFVSYFVLRQLKIKEWISMAGALVYAFLPFIFMRGIEHIVLSSYYFVPLAILMCIWIYEDENFMLPDKGFFLYKKNYAGLIMAFLIANEGIGYWQIFSCFYIFVAMVTGLIRKKDLNFLKRGITSIISIICFVIVACIPQFITIISKNATGVEGRVRDIGNAEVYCLKIIQLFLPVNGHGIEKIQHIIDEYNNGVPLINENQSSYIGIIGIIGFIILMIWLFTDKKDQNCIKKRLTVLADMNNCTIILASIGGFGTIIFVLGVNIIRGYNRISVFIAFICITAVCLVVDEFNKRINNNSLKYLYMCMVSFLFMFSIWEQNPNTVIEYEDNKSKWESDRNFIAEVENIMQEDDCIFQLPYVDYPENGGINNMAHMAHYIGYIHSYKLRWSYGSVIGSQSAVWYKETAELSVDDMVKELSEKGFKGIYINRDGYEESDWKELEKGIQNCTGNKGIVSNNENLSFYKIN